jgi:hypothetical protein
MVDAGRDALSTWLKELFLSQTIAAVATMVTIGMCDVTGFVKLSHETCLRQKPSHAYAWRDMIG